MSLLLRSPLARFLLAPFALVLTPAAAAAETVRVVELVGRVEISPPRALPEGGRGARLEVGALVGTAGDGWALLEYRREGCVDAEGGERGAAVERVILGPGTIHAVTTPAGRCRFASERALALVFQTLARCRDDCERRLTLLADDENAAGLATVADFDRRWQSWRQPPQAERWPLRPRRGPGSRCARYADSAVAQEIENRSKGCGLAGSQWSSERGEHLEHCRGASAADLERRRQARRRILDRCVPEDLGVLGCGAYAARAAAHQDENLWQGCGYEGPAWSADYRQHYRWCVGGHHEEADAENAEREEALERCRAAR